MRNTPARKNLGFLRVLGAALPVVISALLLTTGFWAAPAHAHADLIETSPAEGQVLDAAPETVELHFSEPVQLVDEAMRLFSSDGTPLVLDAKTHNTTVIVSVADNIDDGAYTLAYRVVSADGHPISGALSFQVGEGDYSAPEITASATEAAVNETLVAVLTALHYLGLMAIAGLIMFERFVAASTRRHPMVWPAAITAILASLALIPASGARVVGKALVSYTPGGGSLTFLSSPHWSPGITWPTLVSAAATLSFGVAAALLAHRRHAWVPLGAAVVALATPVLIGHTMTVSPRPLMIAADLGHLFAGAFWLGGVLGLTLIFRSLRSTPRASPRVGRVRSAITTLGRFSRLVPYSVALLIASGTLMGALILGSWQALFTTRYGVLLLVKLALLAIVLAVAAYNRFFVLERIARSAQTGTPETAARLLRRTLSVEALVLVAVIAVTGFLSNTSPNPAPDAIAQDAAQPATFEVESQGLTVSGSLSPGVNGEHALDFTLEYRGAAVDASEVTVEARLPAEELGPLSATALRDPDSGSFAAQLSLPLSGEWNLQFTVRIDTYTEPIAVVTVPVG